MEPPIRIATHADTEYERRGRDQLLGLFRRYDLERWLFTRDVRIQSMTNPRSHPVLTLNTRQLEDDVGQLGTFLHEQFHWFAVQNLERVERAMEELRAVFPVVPIDLPEGCRSERSAYLHLIICHLEWAALRLLVGDEAARACLVGRPYYTWVYEQVLNDDGRIGSVVERHGLGLP